VAPPPQVHSRAGRLLIDEPPLPLVPQHPRTEADQDRIEALAMFAAGRTYEQRQEYDKALRFYQRALRRDPQPAIADAVLSLALRQHYDAVYSRYGQQAVELGIADPGLLCRLAEDYTHKGDFAGALKLYEKLLVGQVGEKENDVTVEIHMEMGRLYYLTDQYKKAADEFARVIRALDHGAELHLGDELKKRLHAAPRYQLFGECFLQAERLPEAAAAFAKSQSLTANASLREFNAARLAARGGKPAEALAALDRALEQHLSDEGTAPYELLADLLKKLDKAKELGERLEKLRAGHPADAALSYFLAEHYRQAGQWDKAEPLYLALAEKHPTLTGYRNLVAAYCKQKQPERLLTVLGDAVDKAGTIEFLGDGGKLLLGDAEMVRGLVETARRTLKAAPERLTFGQRLAVALLNLDAKQWDTAREFFDLALATHPKQAGEIVLAWGLGLLLGERAADAVKVFQRGIDEKLLPPDNPAFEFYLAGALAMTDKTDEALAAARRAADRKEPKSAQFAARTAWILYHAKRNSEAMRAYNELIADFDGDQAAESREVLREGRLALSNLCVLAKQLPAAEEWLEQVLDEFPDDVSASNDLGYLWADQNKHLQRALKMIQVAVAAEPDNAAYRDSLGWVYYRLGRAQEAVQELEKAAAKEADPTLLDHLGEAHWKAAQADKARAAWRRAAEAFRKEKDEPKAKEMEQKSQRKG
jgi:tetratricopeptide (TPR) repeat protein